MSELNEVIDKEGLLKIGTHSGTFHCDEVLACFMLKLLPKYKEAKIVRSRDPDVLSQCDIVVDVGGEFDVVKKRFDHHQKTFHETMNSLNSEFSYKMKLSSAGLVYFYYGREIIKSLMGDYSQDEKIVSIIYNFVYENFMIEVDAIDNGVSQYDSDPRYKITTNLSQRVARLNPAWNDSQSDENERFFEAMSLVGKEFLDKVSYYVETWLPAREIVEEAFVNRHKVDPSKKILLLSRSCPWKVHLFMLESEHDIEKKDQILYVIYNDSAGTWRVQCVPTSSNGFINRKSIKTSWQGLRNKELCEESEISGCVFVHINGFIGGNKTKEGALAMARKSLEAEEQVNT